MKKHLIFIMLAVATVFASVNRPYIDGAGTNALWHMNVVTSNKYVYDDDSAITDRNANIILVPNPIDTAGGPVLVDPLVTGIGYPAGNPDFGQCIYIDGIDDNMMISNASLASLNPEDLRFECWFKANAAVDNQMLFDRWGQIMVYVQASMIRVWAVGVNHDVPYSIVSADPTQWTHVAVEVIGTQMDVYLNDTLAASFTLSTPLTAPSKTTTYIGMRYNSTERYAGYIDEVRISQATAPTPLPDWAKPNIDAAATVLGLWHFDAFADPNTSGVTHKLLPDDDSDNPGRDNDLKLYSGLSTLVNNGQTTGPTLVDPEAAGIGYPYDNPDFGKCVYFDDPILVEGDSFRIDNSEINVDPTNVRVDCWVRPADDLISYVPGGDKAIPYFIIDRWGQFYITLSQATDGSLSIIAMSFGSAGTTDNKSITASYNALGLDPHDWVKVSYRFYMGVAELYINDGLAGTKTLTTNSLMPAPAEPICYIGKRYRSYTNYFWGYIDEMKISQAVYSVGCGALGYLLNDFDKDCFVGVSDLKLLVDQWLDDAITPSVYESVDTGTYEQYATYNIPMASVTPTIDGTLSAGEWADAKEIYLAMPELTTAPNVGSQKYIIPASHDDFSGYYYMKWDATYLYVGIKVIDDVLMFDAGYPDDHATLAFNPRKAGTVSADVAFYNMYRDYFGASQIVNSTGFNALFNPVNAVKANATQADGWSFEVAYKWSDFGGYTPNVGDEHGVAIMICDNDVVDDPDVRDTFLFDSGSGDTTVLGKPLLYRTAVLTSGIVCGDNGYMGHDIGRDCDISLLEYASMADSWLECTDPMTTGCVDAR